MENNNYSPEYLDGVRERFPEYTNMTNQNLIDILSTLKNIENEVIIEDDDQNFLDKIPQSMSDRVNSGLLYIIEKNKGRGDLVLFVREEKNSGGWESTVGSPIFSEKVSFVVDNKNKDYLSPSVDKKLVCILSISPKAEKDSLGRDIFTLTPKLIEIPSTHTLLMQGMFFSKDLTVHEFQEELDKFVS